MSREVASMSFSERLQRKVAHVWGRQFEHPFVTGIGDGTLSLERFRYYIKQDYLFLIGFSRTRALAAAKAESIEDMAWFAKLLHETLNHEMELHRGLCQELGIDRRTLEETRPSPTTLAYTSHLVRTAFSGTSGEIAASMLPCSWGYSEVGQMLKARGAPDEPYYARWIETYSSPMLQERVSWLRSFVDRVATEGGDAERDRMEAAFSLSTHYEHMFWEAAYVLEDWPQ
jgi:thiaminase/transcriptional activator TenA